MMVKKEKNELLKDLPVWIERVLKYARLESATRPSVKKAVKAYDDGKECAECQGLWIKSPFIASILKLFMYAENHDVLHFLFMLTTLMAARSKIKVVYAFPVSILDYSISILLLLIILRYLKLLSVLPSKV